MIQLANSGFIGPAVSAETPVPNGVPFAGVVLNTLQNSDIFSSLLPLPISGSVAREMPTGDLPSIEGEQILPQLPNPELPLELPGGKHLPVAAETPIAANELDLLQATEVPVIPPLAREDVALKKPAHDRLFATALNAPQNGTAPAAPLPPAPPASDTNRQISNLAMAAAKVLTESKRATRAEPVAEPKAPSPEKATAPSKVVPEPSARRVNQPAILPITSSTAPISDAAEKPVDTKPITARPAAESASQQPNSSAPTTTNQAPMASAETGPARQPAMEAKSLAPDATRTDQQATIDRVSDQMMQAREATHTGTTQIRLPHEHFGAIRMQLELAGAGLKVTLGNNDPSFAQSVQLALAERVSAVADTARADSNATRQDGSQQGGGQSSSGSQLSQSGSYAGQSQPQHNQQFRESAASRPALAQDQPITSDPSSEDSDPAQSGLFA